MTDLELLKNKPEGASHVSIPSVLNIPVTWLRYDNDGIYSVWMDDGGTESKPYWREMPNNAIEFPECIRSIYDIEQLAKANERIKELENSFKQSIPIVDTLYALARNQLWIAYVWNDHNFPLNPEKYAKEAAESMGITNVDDANKLVEAFKQLRKEQDGE